jgi:hypothetical protein
MAIYLIWSSNNVIVRKGVATIETTKIYLIEEFSLLSLAKTETSVMM